MSEFVEMKTAELVGAALNWMVAEATQQPKTMFRGKAYALFGSLALPFNDAEQGYSPSCCWHCAGPLIEKYQLDLTFERKGTVYAYPCNDEGLPDTSRQSDEYGSYGATHLIAACRAIVASVLGDTVSVPKELV